MHTIISKLIKKISHLKGTIEFLNHHLVDRALTDKIINFRKFCQEEIKLIEILRKVQLRNKLTFCIKKIQAAKEEQFGMPLSQVMWPWVPG